MAQPNREKRRTNVTLSADTLARARALHLNVSEISDAALTLAVAKAEAEDWSRRNADAIAERRVWIERNGAPLADLQVLRVDE
ncbi:type II toxin-antitoxin system CcdA family antitoxin [Salipiger sp. 1_MG-2023]|uniref:type II toxin-antitoxin system CcdA family antitoxin n=1 Tax=Salipiger sp. 1_MG-2023 TaxID=3062665 RepID=UPI0026E20D1E|nr:type II toxin-antitoxin system CcdA family antitoxin [Salipiger sp. 1_MG-2023]MDO6587492.1 type II toxin-antitoxin system CcdA family antitoxin [Salipiger sp. 1_MG-2023]